MRSLLIVLLIATAARAEAQARDSAGIRLVALRLPATLPRAPFTLREMPSLVLGDSSGDPMQEFSDVPAAVRLSDGTIVVVNRATNELRFFDRTGRFLRTAGRRGQGPGEFTNIAAFALLPGDSLMVQDWSTSRVAVFTARGTLARTFRLGPAPRRPRGALVGAFPDQTLLGAGSDYLTEAEPPPGVFTLTQTLFTFTPAGNPVRELGSMLERQFLFVALLSGRDVARYVLPFGPLGTIRVWRDTYLTGDGGSFEVREYARDGRLFRILRADHAGPGITEADKAAEKQRLLAFYGQRTTSPGFERFWAQVPWQERLPAFRRFEVDPEGRLWIETFESASAPERTWIVFDADRRLLGFVAVPKRLDVLQLTGDGVLGVYRDADDVEQVRYYPFIPRP